MADHLSQAALNTLLTPTFSLGASKTVSGAAAATGAINLTSTAHGIVAPTAPYTYLWAVVANVTGTTEANGLWAVTVPDANHITLTGSTFTNAYVSGGTLKVVSLTAGTLSAALASDLGNLVFTLERCPAAPGVAISTTLAIAP